MTLDEARACIGNAVVYRPHWIYPSEQGVVTSVGTIYVFVRYGTDVHSKATHPSQLEPLTPTSKGAMT